MTPGCIIECPTGAVWLQLPYAGLRAAYLLVNQGHGLPQGWTPPETPELKELPVAEEVAA